MRWGDSGTIFCSAALLKCHKKNAPARATKTGYYQLSVYQYAEQ